ncbi:MAG: recombinase family protein [Prevotella sp.]|nr:recombinase family protein [Prevotella sp.]
MATIGYIFQSKVLESENEAVSRMERLGCERIIIEDSMQEKLRPEWRKMLSRLQKNDTIVITKLSHALRGIRELGAFLDLCQQYGIRLISLEDRIDTGGELYQETSTGDVLATIGRLSSEVMQLRRVEGRSVRLRKETHPRTLKAGLKLDREKTVVNMYNSGHSIDDIWKVSGYKSRTSVFRVLNRHGVKLNRGRHQGPIKKRNER